MTRLADLKVKIFADGAEKAVMLDMNAQPHIKGLTTNPTLMAKAGIRDYEAFARDVLQHIREKPLSLEVFSDEIEEMEREALKVSSWAPNVYLKIPISNTKGESTCGLVRRLAGRGVKVNVTAIMTLAQVRDVVMNLEPEVPSNISVFAGRIADTGIDPLPIMSAAVAMAAVQPLAEVIWASPRELLNIIQADFAGCQIITATYDILKKLPTLGYDLHAYSLDTVKMFRSDAVAVGFRI
jgi:transaldolase